MPISFGVGVICDSFFFLDIRAGFCKLFPTLDVFLRTHTPRRKIKAFPLLETVILKFRGLVDHVGGDSGEVVDDCSEFLVSGLSIVDS